MLVNFALFVFLSLLLFRVHANEVGVISTTQCEFNSTKNLLLITCNNSQDTSLPPTSFHFNHEKVIIKGRLRYFWCIASSVDVVMSYNKISNLNMKSDPCDHIKIVDVSFNLIYSIRSLQSSLEKLNLSNNKLNKIIKSYFNDTTQLKILDLSLNKIAFIEVNSFINLKKLTNLNLFGNQLKSFDINLFNIDNRIEEINLSKNKIEIINSTAFKSFLFLKNLYIADNQIYMIKNNAFENLKQLNFLDLNNNSIAEVNFGNIRKLQVLNLSFNSIEDLDKVVFNSIPNLNRLFISNNKIKELNFDYFINFTNLESVDVSKNKIEKIVKIQIPKNLSLKKIDLSNNNLTEMELWPLYLPGLEYFDLRKNLIESFSNKFNWNFLTESYLPAIPSNVSIDLRYNKIFEFNDYTIQKYGVWNTKDYFEFFSKYLIRFDLRNNPLDCNCSIQYNLIKDTLKYYSNNNISSDWDPTCNTGESLLYFQNCTEPDEDNNIPVQRNELRLPNPIKTVKEKIINKIESIKQLGY